MRKYLTILVLLIPLLFALPHTASAVSWFPLVPCGLNQQPAGIPKTDHDYTQTCNQCLLIELGKNVIDMTFFAIVPSVGTLMFMIAGFIILFNARSGNANGVTKGKEIMTNTAIGIAIILGAWLITNFILKSIANPQIASTPWYTIQCSTGTLEKLVNDTTPSGGGTGTGTGGGVGTGGGTGTQHYSCASDGKSCVSDPLGQYTDQSTCANNCPFFSGGRSGGGGGGASWGKLYTCNSGNQCVEDLNGKYSTANCDTACAPPTGTTLYTCNDGGQCVSSPDGEYDVSGCYGACAPSGTGGTPSGPGGVQCPDSAINICQGTPHTCGTSLCSKYNASITKYATGGATVNLLKAIMFTESSCVPEASNPGGGSYGLMEMQIPTAVKFAQQCQVSGSVINPTWLTDPKNSDTIICLAAAYINSLVPTCGNNPGNLAANYNGANACATSHDCAGTICGDNPPKAWECLYDDTAHTVCNANRATGSFLETRKYVPNILYCVNNPGF